MKKLVIMVLCLVSAIAFPQNDTKRISQYNLDNKLAIKGYDPVSYFAQGTAIRGRKEISVTYQGVLYQFGSNENKESFLKTPSKYEPQYGGWCAFALGSSGEKVDVNPETFKIIDGKLYLFYNAFLNNTLKSWNKDEANLKAQADKNWKKIVK